MSSSNIAREYELVNATSLGENEHTQDDGVWKNSVPANVMNRPTISSRRRRKRLSVLIFVIIIVTVIVVSRRQGGNDNEPSAAEVSSSNNQNDDSAMTEHTANQKTPAPVSPPTASPTAHSATTTHKQQYNCLDERIQNGVKLETGQYICDHYKRYRFGLDEYTGSLLYADDAFNMTVTIHNGTKGDYFELLQDGRFIIRNTTDDVVWQEECSDHVRVSNGCDICPYLHLHSGGTIVLNWINNDGEWKERNILHMYNLPKCHDHFFCYP